MSNIQASLQAEVGKRPLRQYIFSYLEKRLKVQMAPRSNLAGVESIWLKQSRKLVGLSPEVAWPLMDSTGAGTFSCPSMDSGGVQVAQVLDGSQSSLKMQDQGSASDSDTKHWDAGSNCDTAPVSDCDTDGAQKLLHVAVAMVKALEDEHQILRAYTARLYSMGWFPSRRSREEQTAEVKALQKDVQVQAEARFALMELMDACAPWPKLMEVLRSKGLPAFHHIESMLVLRELLMSSCVCVTKACSMKCLPEVIFQSLGY